MPACETSIPTCALPPQRSWSRCPFPRCFLPKPPDSGSRHRPSAPPLPSLRSRLLAAFAGASRIFQSCFHPCPGRSVVFSCELPLHLPSTGLRNPRVIRRLAILLRQIIGQLVENRQMVRRDEGRINLARYCLDWWPCGCLPWSDEGIIHVRAYSGKHGNIRVAAVNGSLGDDILVPNPITWFLAVFAHCKPSGLTGIVNLLKQRRVVQARAKIGARRIKIQGAALLNLESNSQGQHRLFF